MSYTTTKKDELKNQPTPYNSENSKFFKFLLDKVKTIDNINRQTSLREGDKKSINRKAIILIITELSKCDNFITSVQCLAQILENDYCDILNVLKKYKNIFKIFRNNSSPLIYVQLCPQIELCIYNFESSKCNASKNCNALHICSGFIFDKCSVQNCSFGHVWKTVHNSLVLQRYFIVILSNSVLQNLMKNILSVKIPEICIPYNQSECKLKNNCKNLHICYSYVNNLGNCTNEEKCTYIHNVCDPKCLAIFQIYGISINETPMKLLTSLKDRIFMGKKDNMLKEFFQSKETDQSTTRSSSNNESVTEHMSSNIDQVEKTVKSSPIILKDINFVGSKNKMMLEEEFFKSKRTYQSSTSKNSNNVHVNEHMSPNISQIEKVIKSSPISLKDESFVKSEDKKMLEEEVLKSKETDNYINSNSYINMHEKKQKSFIIDQVGKVADSSLISLEDKCLTKGNETEPSTSSSSPNNIKRKKQKWTRIDQVENVANISIDNSGTPNIKQNIEINKSVSCCDFHGNVDVAEICIEHINKKCKFINTSCKYLHCKHKSHWQFGKNDNWYNFHLEHSRILDTKYSDLTCDNFMLSKVNPKNINGQQKSLFNLMGKTNCYIDFENMTMNCEETKNRYSIRQLTTKSSVLINNNTSTTFKWYFLENEGEWKLFGNDCSSEIIEIFYLQLPNESYIFKSTNFMYSLDFANMTQKNLSTKKVRLVKRRPDIFQSNTFDNNSDNSIYESLKKEVITITSQNQNNLHLNEFIIKMEEIMKSNEQSITVYCFHYNGNIEKRNICLEYINLKCQFDLKGCKYLHCKHKSHWQFEIKNNWYNFHFYHSQFLDTKYSDANCDNVTLTKLNPKEFSKNQNLLLSTINWRNSKVNFNTMTLKFEESTVLYSIRQITTKSSAICDDNTSRTKYKWYFLENDEKWMTYGDGDSSSKIIEKSYLEQPSGTKVLKLKPFTYLLDFSKMTQENLTTKKVRQIKRRPEIFQSNNDVSKEKFNHPKHWHSLPEKEEYVLVKLGTEEEEYFEINRIVRLTLFNINIINIYRVQNPNLWKQFLIKQTEIKQKYSEHFLNIQRLFYGINSKHLSDICQNNLDFRLHENKTLVQKRFGEGAYFYNSSNYAANECGVDCIGNKTLLVADVIIGQVALGTQGIIRPPPNPRCNNVLFDTTTNNIENPSLFVKYNKQEYYPAYVVEFKEKN